MNIYKCPMCGHKNYMTRGDFKEMERLHRMTEPKPNYLLFLGAAFIIINSGIWIVLWLSR